MIPAVASVTSLVPAATTTPAVTPATGSPNTDFGSMLSNLLGSLSQTEQNTSQLVATAAAGGNVDVHDVTIAMQAESLAFDVATQVRNKVLEAYSDVFKTQI